MVFSHKFVLSAVRTRDTARTRLKRSYPPNLTGLHLTGLFSARRGVRTLFLLSCVSRSPPKTFPPTENCFIRPENNRRARTRCVLRVYQAFAADNNYIIKRAGGLFRAESSAENRTSETHNNNVVVSSRSRSGFGSVGGTVNPKRSICSFVVFSSVRNVVESLRRTSTTIRERLGFSYFIILFN